MLACDFFVAITATFLYFFVVMEVGWNLTAHPTADWTAQQFRMTISADQPHRYVIPIVTASIRRAWIER
jgi:putative transposase